MVKRLIWPKKSDLIKSKNIVQERTPTAPMNNTTSLLTKKKHVLHFNIQFPSVYQPSPKLYIYITIVYEILQYTINTFPNGYNFTY